MDFMHCEELAIDYDGGFVIRSNDIDVYLNRNLW